MKHYNQPNDILERPLTFNYTAFLQIVEHCVSTQVNGQGLLAQGKPAQSFYPLLLHASVRIIEKLLLVPRLVLLRRIEPGTSVVSVCL